jgi:hypothetical protein
MNCMKRIVYQDCITYCCLYNNALDLSELKYQNEADMPFRFGLPIKHIIKEVNK